MPKWIKHRSIKSGLSPGTLVHIGEKKTEHVRLGIIDYGEERYEERESADIEALLPRPGEGGVAWINVDGLHDLGMVEKIGGMFNIHPLTLEDIVNTGQRPKSEAFDDYLFVVFKQLQFDPDTDAITSEQISLIVGENFLISFQEMPGDAFDPVRDRIRKGRGRIRTEGSGYLAYALIDAVVDEYFAVLEVIGNRIEALEERLLDHPGPETSGEIHALKREMIFFRKQVMPMRQLVVNLLKGDSRMISSTTDVFISDIYDHTIQVIDTVESYRDVLSGLLEIYLSTLSNKMNQVMKVLTVIATVFIPLTFIAGVYGMNFRYMPELEWKWGYFAVWCIMISIGAAMLGIFKLRKWL